MRQRSSLYLRAKLKLYRTVPLRIRQNASSIRQQSASKTAGTDRDCEDDVEDKGRRWFVFGVYVARRGQYGQGGSAILQLRPLQDGVDEGRAFACGFYTGLLTVDWTHRAS